VLVPPAVTRRAATRAPRGNPRSARDGRWSRRSGSAGSRADLAARSASLGRRITTLTSRDVLRSGSKTVRRAADRPPVEAGDGDRQSRSKSLQATSTAICVVHKSLKKARRGFDESSSPSAKPQGLLRISGRGRGSAHNPDHNSDRSKLGREDPESLRTRCLPPSGGRPQSASEGSGVTAPPGGPMSAASPRRCLTSPTSCSTGQWPSTAGLLQVVEPTFARRDGTLRQIKDARSTIQLQENVDVELRGQDARCRCN
jgi:hypothetical protein